LKLTLQVRFRPWQLDAWRQRKRFEVSVWHRRAGKTFASVAGLLIDACETSRDDWRGYYFAPTRVQAKAIAWQMLQAQTRPIPGVDINISELKMSLPNGSAVQLLGAEQYDKLRGLYADAAVLDESADIPTAAWTQVLSPALADRKGRARFIGTPKGRLNLLYEQFEYATTQGDPEWTSKILPHTETTALDESEIARLKRAMSEAEFNQEMLCSFDAAVRGSFWAREMSDMQSEGRVCDLPFTAGFPVYAAIDLGWADTMVCTFVQIVGPWTHILRTRAYELTSLPAMMDDWKDLPFRVDHVVLPSDAKVHELGTGRTRQEVVTGAGYDTSLCPDVGLLEGIEQVRQALPHVRMDREHNRTLIEAATHYRSQYDEVRRISSKTPLHDWSSHFASALRYAIVGRPAALGGYKSNAGLRARMGRLSR